MIPIRGTILLLLTCLTFLVNAAKDSIEVMGMNNRYSAAINYNKASISNWLPFFLYKDYILGSDVFELVQINEQFEKINHKYALTDYRESIGGEIRIPLKKNIGLSLSASENLMIQSRLEQASINSLINQSTDYYNQTMDYTGSFITFLHYQKLGIGIFKQYHQDTIKKHFQIHPKLNLYIPHQFLNATAKHGELFISNDNYYAISSNALIYGNSTPFNRGLIDINGIGVGLDLDFSWYFENDYQIDIQFRDIALIYFFNNYHFLSNHEITYDGLDLFTTSSGGYNQINDYRDTLGIIDTNTSYSYQFPSSFLLKFKKQINEEWTYTFAASNYFRYNVPMAIDIKFTQIYRANLHFQYGIYAGGFGGTQIQLGAVYKYKDWQLSVQTFNLIFDQAHSFGLQTILKKDF